MRDFDFPPLILRDFTRDVSKDLVHELPSTPGLSSSPPLCGISGVPPPTRPRSTPPFFTRDFCVSE